MKQAFLSIGRAVESVSDVEFRFDEPLARHTSFRVGGPVRLLARPLSESAIFPLLETIRKLGLPFIILGEGSNVLAPDGPWEMSVLQLHLACNTLLLSGQGAEGTRGQPGLPLCRCGNNAPAGYRILHRKWLGRA